MKGQIKMAMWILLGAIGLGASGQTTTEADPLVQLRSRLGASVDASSAIRLDELELDYRHGKQMDRARSALRSKLLLINDMTPPMQQSLLIQYQIFDFAAEARDAGAELISQLRATVRANATHSDLRDWIITNSRAQTQLEDAVAAYERYFLVRLMEAQHRLEACDHASKPGA